MNFRSLRATKSAAPLLSAVFIAILVALGVLTAGPVAAATSSEDVTWGVRTATNDNGTERQNFSYTIDPGEKLSDALIVSNHATKPLELDVYAADGFTTSSGQLDLVTTDTKSTAVGVWTVLPKGALTIAPGKSVEVPFTVTVPADATPGDYAGGILTSLPHSAQKDGISVDRRLGIRMHVRVGGALAPSIAIEDMRVDYTGTFNPFGTGAATVAYTVHNTGNVRVAAGQAVSLSGPFGLLPIDVKAVAPVPELLPGESWTVSVPVDGVFPAFWLSASTTLAPELAVVAGTTPGLSGVAATAGTVTVPWALLVLVVLVAGAVVGMIVVLRRRRRQRALREDERVKQAVEKALKDSEANDLAAV